MPSGLMREGFRVVRANMPQADLYVCVKRVKVSEKGVVVFSPSFFVFRLGVVVDVNRDNVCESTGYPM